jgi:hypothetical protein
LKCVIVDRELKKYSGISIMTINMAKRKTSDTPPSGKTVLVFTPAERVADMQAFGREIRQSKETAQAFLVRAGILTPKGDLAKPYRA